MDLLVVVILIRVCVIDVLGKVKVQGIRIITRSMAGKRIFKGTALINCLVYVITITTQPVSSHQTQTPPISILSPVNQDEKIIIIVLMSPTFMAGPLIGNLSELLTTLFN